MAPASRTEGRMERERRHVTNHYAIMELHEFASGLDARRAYHRLALLWHPDRQVHAPEARRKEAEDRFKRINEAYAVLGDEGRKQDFDNVLRSQMLGFPGSKKKNNHETTQPTDQASCSDTAQGEGTPAEGPGGGTTLGAVRLVMCPLCGTGAEAKAGKKGGPSLQCVCCGGSFHEVYCAGCKDWGATKGKRGESTMRCGCGNIFCQSRCPSCCRWNTFNGETQGAKTRSCGFCGGRFHEAFCPACSRWGIWEGNKGCRSLLCDCNGLFYEISCRSCGMWGSVKGRHADADNSLHCGTCGFESHEAFCPSCRQWDSFPGAKGDGTLMCRSSRCRGGKRGEGGVSFFQVYCERCASWRSVPGDKHAVGTASVRCEGCKAIFYGESCTSCGNWEWRRQHIDDSDSTGSCVGAAAVGDRMKPRCCGSCGHTFSGDVGEGLNNNEVAHLSVMDVEELRAAEMATVSPGTHVGVEEKVIDAVRAEGDLLQKVIPPSESEIQEAKKKERRRKKKKNWMMMIGMPQPDRTTDETKEVVVNTPVSIDVDTANTEAGLSSERLPSERHESQSEENACHNGYTPDAESKLKTGTSQGVARVSATAGEETSSRLHEAELCGENAHHESPLEVRDNGNTLSTSHIREEHVPHAPSSRARTRRRAGRRPSVQRRASREASANDISGPTGAEDNCSMGTRCDNPSGVFTDVPALPVPCEDSPMAPETVAAISGPAGEDEDNGRGDELDSTGMPEVLLQGFSSDPNASAVRIQEPSTAATAGRARRNTSIGAASASGGRSRRRRAGSTGTTSDSRRRVSGTRLTGAKGSNNEARNGATDDLAPTADVALGATIPREDSPPPPPGFRVGESGHSVGKDGGKSSRNNEGRGTSSVDGSNGASGGGKKGSGKLGPEVIHLAFCSRCQAYQSWIGPVGDGRRRAVGGDSENSVNNKRRTCGECGDVFCNVSYYPIR